MQSHSLPRPFYYSKNRSLFKNAEKLRRQRSRIHKNARQAMADKRNRIKHGLNIKLLNELQISQ